MIRLTQREERPDISDAEFDEVRKFQLLSALFQCACALGLAEMADAADWGLTSRRAVENARSSRGGDGDRGPQEALEDAVFSRMP